MAARDPSRTDGDVIGEDIKGNVNILEKAFRNLIRIYDQHNLKDEAARRSLELEGKPSPRIICSEALV